MTQPPRAGRPRRTCRRSPRRAFTFLEVLFAVMILGIGMIMVAAMFPAGIRQSQANVEDTASMTLSRNFARQMQQMAGEKLSSPVTVSGVQYDYAFDYFMQPYPVPNPTPGHPKVYSFHDPRGDIPATRKAALWNWVRGNLVLAADPTYAFVPLFSRDYNQNPTTPEEAYKDQAAVTLYVIPVRVRNKSTFSVDTDTAYTVSALDPILVQIAVVLKPYAADCRVTVSQIVDGMGPSAPGGGLNPLEEGCYLVMSDISGTMNAYNGQVFRLGARLPAGADPILGATIPAGNDTVYSLAADRANGALPSPTAPPAQQTVNFSGLAFAVGRGPTDTVSANAHQVRSGPPQDLGVLPTMISLRLK